MRHCPQCYCGSKVIETRETDTTVRRVRQCRKCARRWTTWEMSRNGADSMKAVRERLGGVWTVVGRLIDEIDFGGLERSQMARRRAQAKKEQRQ